MFFSSYQRLMSPVGFGLDLFKKAFFTKPAFKSRTVVRIPV
jgi:hypothetical protein